MARGYGIGSSSGRRMGAAPTNPGNGSGGAGTLVVPSQAFGAGRAYVGEGVSDIAAGRITLAAVMLTIVALGGFYVWTRSAQGG